ncbi:hypothetical protein ACAH01_09335 [Halomicrobium sp. HM KBTZ05]|nr:MULTISPECIES: hypothetical protein [Halomicrobium]
MSVPLAHEHMQEAWIQLQCPDCTTEWEQRLSELPASGERFQCDHCDAYNPTAEFAKTTRDLEVLREMNGAE